jgi:hypothetical protein
MGGVPANGKLVVRTSNEDDVLVFDASLEQADFERIDIVCPNGRQMGMTAWLSELAAGQSIDIAALIGTGFSVSRNREHAESVLGGSMNGDPGSLKPQSDNPSFCPPEDTLCCPKSQTCYWNDGVWTCGCGLQN